MTPQQIIDDVHANQGDGQQFLFVFLKPGATVLLTIITTAAGITYATSQSYMDSAVKLQALESVPNAGDTYVAPSALPNDNYGRSVSSSTDTITDTYSVSDDSNFDLSVVAGTSLEDVYKEINAQQPNLPDLATAKSNKLSEFNDALQQYIKDRYTTDQSLQLSNLYTLAKEDGLTNRAAYIRQGLTWGRSLIAYAVTFSASVNTQTDPATVVAMTWNIDANVSADPQIKAGAAIQIPN